MENKKIGALFMCLSALGFALMATCVKLVGPDVNTFQKLFYRNIVTVIIAFYAMKKSRLPLLPSSPKSFKLMMARSLVGLTGAIGFFYAITNLPLADSAMLNKLSPFFVMIFATVFLKEKFRSIQLLPIGIVVIGALLVIKPTFNVSMVPALAGFFSAMCAGAAYTLVRHLREMEAPNTIVFYFGVVSIVVTLPLMFIFGYITPNTHQLLFLLGAGIFATMGQICLSYAYRYAAAGEVSIYQYLSIIFSAIIGIILFKEIPDIYSLLGGALIITAALGNYYIGHKYK